MIFVSLFFLFFQVQANCPFKLYINVLYLFDKYLLTLCFLIDHVGVSIHVIQNAKAFNERQWSKMVICAHTG